MPKLCLFILLLGTLSLAAQEVDSLDFALPEYANPFYESFTRNYLSTVAMGRGNTGVAMSDGLDNVLLNPAGYQPLGSSIHMELLVKPPVDNSYYREGVNYTSPAPFGIAGLGGSLGDSFSGALLYSLPKSITVDNFYVLTNQGNNMVVRYPAFYLHQLTVNAAWHYNNFHLGLNLHNQVYYLSDVTFLRTFERVQQGKYFLRPQLGLLYTGARFNAGITATPPQNAVWDLKYATYDSQLPLNVALGGTYKSGNVRLTAEAEYEQDSALSGELKDHLMIKVGAEKTVRKFTYRAGYIYNPEVWSGAYRLPENTTANADTSIWWGPAAVPHGGVIGAHTQHLATFGLSWMSKDVNINLAALVDVGGKTSSAQLNVSLDLYFSAFRKKGFLFFD